jgi:hypothetical protein
MVFYLAGMTKFLMVLLLIAMLAVLGVLITGMVGVARGMDPARSNRLMRWRVILQGVALFIFVLLMLSRR